MCVSHSVVSDSADPWTVAHQATLSMGFSRQEYWNRLPVLSLRHFPDPGIEPRSPTLQADSLLSEPLGKSALVQLDSISTIWEMLSMACQASQFAKFLHRPCFFRASK